MHGAQDEVIPVSMAHKLAKLANEPKRLVILPKAEHSDLYIDGNNALPVMQE